jgi:hypothetical protein
MSDIYSMNCDHCAVCVHIGLYDLNFTGSYMRYGYTPALDRALEPILKSCKCGGRFRGDAPYRCPVCLSAFAREEVVKHIDQRVGFLIMSNSVPASEYWKDKKDKLAFSDRAFLRLRIFQSLIWQWSLVFKSMFRKS